MRRNDAANLLMAGAAPILALDTALFNSWVAAAIVDGKGALARAIAIGGTIFTFMGLTVWCIARHRMNKSIPAGEEKLDMYISAGLIALFVCVAVAWGFAALLHR